ncbi:MAG: hypothetical protein CL565_06665 [Alphaproteobacteria bacterium]|nr:hypothetical protein [Alphaproteobacteria bacterium]
MKVPAVHSGLEKQKIRTVSAPHTWDLDDRESYFEMVSDTHRTFKVKETFESDIETPNDELCRVLEHMTEDEEYSFSRAILFLYNKEMYHCDVTSQKYLNAVEDLAEEHWLYQAEASGFWMMGQNHKLIDISNGIPDHAKYSEEDLMRAEQRYRENHENFPAVINVNTVSLEPDFKKASLGEKLKAMFTREKQMSKAAWVEGLEEAIEAEDYERFYELCEMVNDGKIATSQFSVVYQIEKFTDQFMKDGKINQFSEIAAKLGMDGVYARIVAKKIKSLKEKALKDDDRQLFYQLLKVAGQMPVYLSVFDKSDIDKNLFAFRLEPHEKLDFMNIISQDPRLTTDIFDPYLEYALDNIIKESDIKNYMPLLFKLVENCHAKGVHESKPYDISTSIARCIVRNSDNKTLETFAMCPHIPADLGNFILSAGRIENLSKDEKYTLERCFDAYTYAKESEVMADNLAKNPGILPKEKVMELAKFPDTREKHIELRMGG